MVRNVGGVRARITREKKEYEHEEKRCRHRRRYSLPPSLILTRGYTVSSFLYEEAAHLIIWRVYYLFMGTTRGQVKVRS